MIALHFAAAPTDAARAAFDRLTARYGQAPIEAAEIIVALGGDGLMLETIHATLARGVPVYGMNCGSVGFLMNDYAEAGLIERVGRALGNDIFPLRMHVVTMSGAVEEALAFNEVSLLRQLRQAAKIRIAIDGTVRLPELICDGVLLATDRKSVV